ncbi:hypothetical protein GDI0239 [Gluconacetobacter diazotrophicus PA1 5]|uniref:Uncharacterized protein n=1 Tax=Gluconacetobacter diazotrophicus (strain ATCC 49037 / DSM 5601 / CCUG 37298 / CIP 103539 / LMG 7603 / PAl5) TaxID=272568 RepID=A9H2P7_GLUDA|nr:hypothetical protein GDI0239 [Gluconacetobacter diazotrophicus PA1 5]
MIDIFRCPGFPIFYFIPDILLWKKETFHVVISNTMMTWPRREVWNSASVMGW